MELEYICLWYDGEDFIATRCTIDIATGMPVGFPVEPNTSVNVIIEFEKGHEPTLYDEAVVSEMKIENVFPF